MKTDLKYAFRTLRRSPGFAFAAIVTLALGIAANGTVFTLVNGALLRDLPLDSPDRIVSLGVRPAGDTRVIDGHLSVLALRDWQASARTFEGIGGYDEQTMNFDPAVYVPLATNPEWSVNILVRGSTDLGAVSTQIQDQIRAVDVDIPVFDVRTIDDLLAFRRWAQNVFGSMFAIFAVIALTMASVGLYAVTAYAVAQRTREIGLRIALGAGVRQVWWLVTQRASIQVVTGLAIGLIGSIAVLRLVPLQVTRSDGNHSATLIIVAVLLVSIAFVACLIPARRALAVDPAQTLRQ